MHKIISTQQCQLVDEWNEFLSTNFSLFSATKLTDKFQCTADLVHYDTGVKFTKVTASPRIMTTIKSSSNAYFFLILSKGPIKWINGSRWGELKQGGMVVFDLSKTVRYELRQHCDVTTLLLPYDHYIDDATVESIRHHCSPLFNDAIYEILQGMTSSDDNLYQKIMAVSSLLPLIICSRKNEKKADKIFDLARKYIRENAHDSSFNLHKLATKLYMTERAIQRLLVANGTTYSQLIKVARISLLTSKLKKSTTKTISQMCYESGFNSYANAYMQFKSVHGQTIGELKLQLKLPQ